MFNASLVLTRRSTTGDMHGAGLEYDGHLVPTAKTEVGVA